jgi:hypothetical protein
MNGLSYDFNHGEVIRVKRDSIIHMWAVAVGDHWVQLPWKETADAFSVVLWIKEQTDGAAQVQVEL